MPAALIDANILVYAHDPDESVKQAQAIALLDHLYETGYGRLSVQSLGEFFYVITRGNTPRLSPGDAAARVDLLIRAWPVLSTTPFVVLEAMRGVHQHRLAYWDAQIWATARLNQIPIIVSEDYSVGSVIEGVRFVNPFALDFDRDRWFPAR
jgi:predicted nucleic acid-binding protein